MVGEAALRRLGLRPGSLPGPQMALRGRRHEWQRLISARSHAAVERMIAARVRR
jgi:hypothetical protein